LVPSQAIVAQHIQSFREFPPRQGQTVALVWRLRRR
jgi:hypothetical protein